MLFSLNWRIILVYNSLYVQRFRYRSKCFKSLIESKTFEFFRADVNRRDIFHRGMQPGVSYLNENAYTFETSHHPTNFNSLLLLVFLTSTHNLATGV